MLLWLAYQSIGVIYGDIGTSPLYVFSSTFSSEPSYDDLVGVLSIIIWSLAIMVTLKYVIIILRADNDGEGGTFSTYSLLSRYVSSPPSYCSYSMLTLHRPTSPSVILVKLHSSRSNVTRRKTSAEQTTAFATFSSVVHSHEVY